MLRSYGQGVDDKPLAAISTVNLGHDRRRNGIFP